MFSDTQKLFDFQLKSEQKKVFRHFLQKCVWNLKFLVWISATFVKCLKSKSQKFGFHEFRFQTFTVVKTRISELRGCRQDGVISIFCSSIFQVMYRKWIFILMANTDTYSISKVILSHSDFGHSVFRHCLNTNRAVNCKEIEVSEYLTSLDFGR